MVWQAPRTLHRQGPGADNDMTKIDIICVIPAAGTEEVPSSFPLLTYQPDMSRGEHPLVLAQNEAALIRNRTVWPLTGTGLLQIEIAWAEVDYF